jgi:hypothetical protein
MSRLLRYSLVAALAAAVSLAMCSQNALMLVLDPVTGDKHCISRLPSLLGLAQHGVAATIVNVACQAWLVLLPLALVLAAIRLIQRRRDPRPRVRSTPA